MDILIKNVELPRGNNVLVVDSAGTITKVNRWTGKVEATDPLSVKAVALPEHGRLISESDIASLIIADIQRLETTDEYTDREKELVREVYQSCLYKLGITPTIVEATE